MISYYHCRNCGWFFTKRNNKSPYCCPNCKEKSLIGVIDKGMYDDWLQNYKMGALYNKTFGDTDRSMVQGYLVRVWMNDDLLMNYLNMVWREYGAVKLD